MKQITILFLIVITIFSSCEETTSSEEQNPTDGLILIGSETNNGVHVQAYIDENNTVSDSLLVGYNKLYFLVQDEVSGENWTMAHIGLNPEMSMMSKSHGCPYVNPAMDPDENGFFVGEIFPTMGSSSMNNWTLWVDVIDHAQSSSANLSIDFKVKDTGNLWTFYDVTDDSAAIYVTLILPNPTVGVQEIEFTIHEKESAYSWPARDDYLIEMEPWMPAMGHGSTGNENPTSTTNGHYAGKVNFSMTGDWEIRLTITRNGMTVGNFTYNVTLK